MKGASFSARWEVWAREDVILTNVMILCTEINVSVSERAVRVADLILSRVVVMRKVPV